MLNDVLIPEGETEFWSCVVFLQMNITILASCFSDRQEGQERLHHFFKQGVLRGVKIYKFCSGWAQRKGNISDYLRLFFGRLSETFGDFPITFQSLRKPTG